jgi:uncharacterized protein DUF4337
MSESHEALERFESAHEVGHGHGGGLARMAALTVAIVAAFLAVSTFLGNESVKEAIQGQTKVADHNADAQTFDTQDEIFQSDELILSVFARSSDAETAKAAQQGLDHLLPIEKKVGPHQDDLAEKVKEAKKEVTHANDQHLRYEIAEVLLQIAIVLASVAIVSNKRFLLYGGHGVAVAGVVVLGLGLLV